MAQEPREERHSQAGEQQHPATGAQPQPRAPAPRDAVADAETMAICKQAGSIAEVIDNPNMQIQRVRIG